MSERRNQSSTPPIVHRDIKPSNIILTEDGRIVLIDLNAARLDDKNRSHDTQLIGTAGFAAPEQYGFAASSPRADLYAAGILMRMLLTGTDANDAMLLLFCGVSLLFVIFCLLIAFCLPSASRGSSQTADSTSPDSSEALPDALPEALPEAPEYTEADYPFLGIYRGNTSDYLTLDADGTASYYCTEYTDLNCP